MDVMCLFYIWTLGFLHECPTFVFSLLGIYGTPIKETICCQCQSFRPRVDSSDDESPPLAHFDRKGTYGAIAGKDDGEDEKQQIRHAEDAVIHDEDKED
ncbi:hypothetical protein VNO78_02640 [Psophocarpus tetragonolobus]|uniref:Uncharacterized protein n=1 Tax=Psophocarpus tetragonolobus TaxID=3891 RepID=A0AAN9T2T2_PSOTE